MNKLNARMHKLDKPLTEKQYTVDVSGAMVLERLVPADRAKLDAYWQTVTERMPGLFRKPVMLNLQGVDIHSDGITEHDDLGDYGMFVGKRNPDIPPAGFAGAKRSYGTDIYTAGISDDAARNIRLRGASTFTLTSDGFVLVGRRPANVLAPNQISILPEGMLVISNPNPFTFTKARLDRETGIESDSIASLEMVAFGEELTHCAVVSAMVIELNKTRASLEASMHLRRQTAGIGIPEGLKFMEASLSTLLEYLSGRMNRTMENPNGINPAACNVAILGAIYHQYGQMAFEKALERSGSESQLYPTPEAFFSQMGVEVRHLARS